MISQHFEPMVTLLLPAGEFQVFRREDLPRLPASARDGLLAAAEKALAAPLPQADLALWRASAADYDSRRAEARRACAALCFGEAVEQKGRFLPAAAEALYQLLNEPSWNQSTRRAVPMRGLSPDTFAAETAELVGWALPLLGEGLERYAPGMNVRAAGECEDRVLSWLDDPACCEAALRRADAPCAARAFTVACLLIPQDDSARWLRLKNALRIADRCLTGGWLAAAHSQGGLESWLESACALADALLLTDLACSGQSGLRGDEEIRLQMRLPLDLAMGGPYFTDEKTAMRPRLSGSDVYRIGAAFDDDDLCALGARLRSLNAEEDAAPGNITARVLDALWRASLEREKGALVLPECAEVRRMGYIAARPEGGKGFWAALHAGALVLFLDGAPVLVEGPEGAAARSLPEPNDCRQSRSGARDIQAKAEGFLSLSMDVAPTFPAEASISTWQRTVMITNSGDTVRLLDAFDFAGDRRPCALRFVTPVRPVVAVGAPRVRLGPVYLQWDGEMEPSVAQVSPEGEGEPLWALLLRRGTPMAGGCWTCTFTRAE